MLRLEGAVLSVIRHPQRTGRDGKTYDSYSQVQLQVEELLENDQLRYGIHTLTTVSPDEFEQHQGKVISIPVRAYSKGGSVAFMMPAAAKPEPVKNRALEPAK